MSDEKPVRLGELLLSSGIIDQLQLNTALKYQKAWDRKLGEALVELGFLSEEALVKVLSKFLKVPAVELSQIRVNQLAVQKVPKRLADKHGAFPIGLEGKEPAARLIVAMKDPTNLKAIDEIAFTAGCRVRPVVASHSDIDKAIRRYYGEDRIVDIFFSLEGGTPPTEEAKESPTAITFEEEFSKPLEANLKDLGQGAGRKQEEMIVMRGGVETLVNFEDDVKPVSPPKAPPPPPVREAFNADGQIIRPAAPPPAAFDRSAFQTEERQAATMLKALIRLLLDKGLISKEELDKSLKGE